MKTNVCTYCGGTLSPADYHVVGIDDHHANLLACVPCWRAHGLVTTRPAPITTTPAALTTTTAQGRLLL